MVRASGNLCRAGGSEWIPIVMVCYYILYVLLLLGLRHLYRWLLTAVSVYSVLWTAKAHSCVQSWTKSHLRMFALKKMTGTCNHQTTALLQLHEYSYITKWNRWLYIVISLPQTSFNTHLTPVSGISQSYWNTCSKWGPFILSRHTFTSIIY